MFRLSVRDFCSFKRQSLAISIAAGAAALFLATPIAATAAECSVATYGQAAYARVQEKVKERFFKVEQFQFPAYEEVEISISSGCLIKVQGEFSFKQARNLKRKKFDADLIPKATAPHGVKIEKLRVSN